VLPFVVKYLSAHLATIFWAIASRRTLAFGSRVYSAIFSQYFVNYCEKCKLLEDFSTQINPLYLPEHSPELLFGQLTIACSGKNYMYTIYGHIIYNFYI